MKFEFALLDGNEIVRRIHTEESRTGRQLARVLLDHDEWDQFSESFGGLKGRSLVLSVHGHSVEIVRE